MASCAESRRDSHAEENPSVTFDDYARAERFCPPISRKSYWFGSGPSLIDEGDCFWYKFDTRQGKRFVFVDQQQARSVTHSTSPPRGGAVLVLAPLRPRQPPWTKEHGDGHQSAFKAGSVNWLSDRNLPDRQRGCSMRELEEVLSPDGKYAHLSGTTTYT